MKNLTNKQKVIAISTLVVLFCIGFLLGIFTGIERKNRDMNALNTNTLENINNKVTTIDIETAFTTEENTKSATLNQEDIYVLFNIIDHLNFKKETCDGVPYYYFKYNSEDENAFVTYGLEMFDNVYHITNSEKGEAVLSPEQVVKIRQIQEKYLPTAEIQKYKTEVLKVENEITKELEKQGENINHYRIY